jgi:hypothetical protein
MIFVSPVLHSLQLLPSTHHIDSTMSPNPKSKRSPFEMADLMHKLGFPSRPAPDRKKEIEANMQDLQKWLDKDDYTPTPNPAPHDSKDAPSQVDHVMGKPAVLIASTGSIRKKKKLLDDAAAAAPPAHHLVPSDNTGHLGSVKYEPGSMNARPEGLESFPRLSPTPSELEEGGTKTKVPKR